MFPNKPPKPGGRMSIAAQQARVVNHAIFTTRGQQGIIKSLWWRFQNRDFSAEFMQDANIGSVMRKLDVIADELKEVEKALLAYNARKKGAPNG